MQLSFFLRILQQEPLDKALGEAKEILEAFADGESLDPTLDAANTLKEDIKSDDAVSQYFKGVSPSAPSRSFA
jgi:hypothetical protein